MARRWLVGITLAGLVFGSGLAWARPGVVKTRAGLSYEGEVEEKPDNSVVVTIRGVQTTLTREQVASIDYAATFDEQFKDRRAKLGEKDAAGRIALGRYAFENQKYAEAEAVLQEALALDPSNADAQSMLETVRVQARMDANRGAPPAPGTARPPEGAAGAPTRSSPGNQERPTLTGDEINFIRQSELRPDDAQVRITVPQELKRKFAIANNMTFAQFNAMRPVEQALDVLRKGDDDARKQIRIMGDPSTIATFKATIQPMLLSGCATSGCHGGAGSGNFGLFSPSPNDASAYANFVLLQRYAKSFGETGAGFFGSGQRRMIERGKGTYSILANYALPADVSEIDHPRTDGGRYNGMFRGKDDPRYVSLVNWIDGLNIPDPDYAAIKIPGPARMPATAPSPATAPTPSQSPAPLR